MKDEYGIEHFEVHTEDCKWLDRTKYSERLGNFLNCQGAISEAKNKHPGWRIDGCKHCSPDCHSV
jgi:hypothetical protein